MTTFDYSSNTYNITGTWTLNPLAAEVIANYTTQLQFIADPENSPPTRIEDKVALVGYY